MSNTNLTKEEIIAAWKDPQVREKSNNLPEHPSGKSYGDLTEEELTQIQGASDVKPETSPICYPLITFVPTSITTC
ncbi:mersacidin/lichenicidin family type 2 lantibiotic [Metabacillus crassostreae]|uniref:mersacidin/lichenicidin family type 2 lantibiotic n=1 Tax=Metabacillus crassostreae TaxID=929098 RepID=UPI001958F896|nr:mersacidin/lichenicidin family type 2 lantibiotic [Metabacillus crassostreae]